MGTVRSAALAFLSASLLIGLSTRAEDPLPLVQPKSTPAVAETPQASSGADVFAMPQVAMAVYPLQDLAAIATIDTSDPSALRTILREAAAANDQPRFDAALARAKSVAESLPASDERKALLQAVSVYSDLQQLWTYADSDRYGAFYDDQSLPGVRARLANNYNGYASYIGQYSLTDDNGRVFYPTAETRAFILRQAGGGGPQIALHRAPATELSATRESRRSHTTATTPAAATAPAAALAPAATLAPNVPATHHKRIDKAESTPQPALKTIVKTAVKATPAPVNVAAAKPASAIAQAPAPTFAFGQPGQASSGPAPPPDALSADMHRAAHPPAPTAPQPKAVEASAVEGSRQTQGLLFIIIALVTIGVMTIWARTPQSESQPAQIFKPAEPLTSAESPSPKTPEADTVRIKQNRAS